MEPFELFELTIFYFMFNGHLILQGLDTVDLLERVGGQFSQNRFVLSECHDACRVVASVLQEFDAFETDLMRIFLGGQYTDDSTALLYKEATFFF